jgi:hypothetical protein
MFFCSCRSFVVRFRGESRSLHALICCRAPAFLCDDRFCLSPQSTSNISSIAQILNHALLHQNSTYLLPRLLRSIPSKILMYPTCRKLGTVLEKLVYILVEVFGSAIFYPVLLGSSPTNNTHNKEAHYFHET